MLPGLVAGEHRRFAFLHYVLGAAHRGGGILTDDLADDQPVEQHADRARCCLTVAGL